MANRNIHTNDIVWINPDTSPRIGRMVLARVWDLDGSDCGNVVKIWRRNHDGGDLWGDGEDEEGRNPVICSRYEITGAVVWIQPHGFEPR